MKPMIKRSRYKQNRTHRPNHTKMNDNLAETGQNTGSRLDYRPPKNRIVLQQNIDKHLSYARDSISNGDRIQAEGHLQYADHFQRLLNEQDEMRQQAEQKRVRNEQSIINDLQQEKKHIDVQEKKEPQLVKNIIDKNIAILDVSEKKINDVSDTPEIKKVPQKKAPRIATSRTKKTPIAENKIVKNIQEPVAETKSVSVEETSL